MDNSHFANSRFAVSIRHRITYCRGVSPIACLNNRVIPRITSLDETEGSFSQYNCLYQSDRIYKNCLPTRVSKDLRKIGDIFDLNLNFRYCFFSKFHLVSYILVTNLTIELFGFVSPAKISAFFRLCYICVSSLSPSLI
jgi:hypothetical protein